MDNLCNICKDENDHTSIRLKCSHVYHRECILLSIKNTSNECPYCRKYIYINDIINTTCTTCKAIIKTGKNKDKQCTNIANNLYGDYCGKHKNNNG